MSAVWDKLFGNGPLPANDIRAAYEEQQQLLPPPRNPSPPPSPRENGAFDSIGRRNEDLRAQLDAIEFAFSNIDVIRTHFLAVLGPIDEILQEIERTKTRHLESETKLISLTGAHDKLKNEHAELTIDRNALALKQGELSSLARDFEAAAARTAAELNEAKNSLAAHSGRADRLERELEDSKRRLAAVSEQLPSLRAEFEAKEKRLQESEQQRAVIEDRLNLAGQESRSLRVRVEELVGNSSKLNRQINELEGRNGDARRRVGELESALGQETAAHAKLKNAHFDDAESHRLAVTSLREDIHALTVRCEGAERLLDEARNELRERSATIRGYEQASRESALVLQAREQAQGELEKALSAAHHKQTQTEHARAVLDQRGADLARELDQRTTALRRAEEQISALETRMSDEIKLAISELELRDVMIAKLRSELESQSAARAFAEGALQSARQERVSWHRSMDPSTETSREKLNRLRA